MVSSKVTRKVTYTTTYSQIHTCEYLRTCSYTWVRMYTRLYVQSNVPSFLRSQCPYRFLHSGKIHDFIFLIFIIWIYYLFIVYLVILNLVPDQILSQLFYMHYLQSYLFQFPFHWLRLMEIFQDWRSRVWMPDRKKRKKKIKKKKKREKEKNKEKRKNEKRANWNEGKELEIYWWE